MRRVGVLINLSENDFEAQRLITAFRERLAQLGWIDGRNLRIDYRWGSGDVDRVRAFAKELVGLSPDVVVGYATPSVLALQRETSSIPIVFLSVTDPVGQGLVASLAHPGGNITGFAVFEFSLGTICVQRLRRRWWTGQLWREPDGCLPPRWCLRGPDSLGGEAGRSSG
jgi:ABC transporter substrate binding protein